ncbi:hypothetical protein AAFF_G00126400 [Aldrovandia affinis]|uniref:C2H2-type domain-containing protein n=1 Tax=Aldrovandia affinis TaxID=143900 RepID=A0AAD7RR70_9TELE|nr:hypothetical protein AAFF_G00126400 [Aldrovandia affinis]
MEAAPRPTDEQTPREGGVVMTARQAEPSAPQNLAPGPTSEGLKAQTKVGGVRNVRKDIPAKKDRLEPLKIDMSKHFLMPATSAQLSLQCLECHIIFSDHKSKKRHLKQSHPAEYEQCMLGDALFACYVCDRHFACSTELMAHQRAHTEKQPFKCPICGEAFRRSSELTIHKKVHFGLHGYTCLECGKPCKTLTLLKYHQRTHTGERPYVCKDCGKRFSMSKALQKHLLTHVQEEDTEAGGGGTILQTPTGDTTHIKKLGVSSQGKPVITFSCSLCDGIFKTAKTRLQHMKLKHSQGRETARNIITEKGEHRKEGRDGNRGAGEQIRGAGDCHSPSILLERFLTGRERCEGDVEQCQDELRNNNRQQVDHTSSGFSMEAGPRNDGGRMTLMGSVMGQVIKVEDYSSDLIPCPNDPSATPGREGAVVISQVDPCEQQQGVRMFLVKEEDPLILDEPQAFLAHRQSQFPEEELRVEGNTCAGSEAVSLEDREGGGDGEMEEAASIPPLVLGVGVRGNEQCIFFRMKEEENEVVLEPPQREHGLSVLLVSRAAGLGQRANPSHTDAEGPLVSDLHSGQFTDSSGIWVSVPPEQGVAEIEECDQDTERSIQMGTQHNVYVCTGEGEVNTEQQSSEELIEFLQQKSDAEHSDSSDSEPEGEAYAMACYHDSMTGGSMSTNKISSKKHDCSRLNIRVQGRSVIAKEVAQFVGIHIAMGTLKFPDKKLYWQDFTRVPLIADTMSASRFAQLARKLRLARQPKDSELPMGTDMDGGSACGDGGVALAEGPGNQQSTEHRMDTEGPVSMACADGPAILCKTRKTDTVSHRDAAMHKLGDGVVEQRPGDPWHTSQHCDLASLAQIPARPPTGSARAEHTHNTRSHTHYTRKRAREGSNVQTLGDESGMQDVSNAHSKAQRSEGGHGSGSTCMVNTDPLWQVRGVLDRVRSGCLLLSHEGNYGVDQHPLYLGHCCWRKSLKNSCPALQCAVLLGAGGLVLDLNLSLNDSDREDTLQKMIPRNKENGEGLVFLCKEELCTPVMLERLLVSGVRSAGRVGGVRGGVGDEFVSSDGRLTLLRCKQGFILSTLTKMQAHQVSLAKDFEGAQKDAQLNRDLLNLYSTPLSASSPTRWPQSVLWHLTDLALVNSWLQFRQDRSHSLESLNLMAFRLEVAKALIHTNGSNMPHSAPPHPPASKLPGQDRAPSPTPLLAAPLPDAAVRYDGLGHWPEQLAEGEGARCRFGGCERTSRVRCLKCCVFLCISRNHNCFLKFHSQGSI